MYEVIFTSEGVVNGVTYVEGSELRVSDSIFEDLFNVQKCVKEKKTPKSK